MRQGKVHLMQNLRLRGRPPTIILARIVRPMNALQFLTEIFHTKKLSSRLSLSKVQFYTKNGCFAYFSAPLSPDQAHLDIGCLVLQEEGNIQ